ncbi:MAG: sulfatase [Lentisphaeria bacterium]|nr:sulfatase [Lentisphaeria bacterium]
MATVLAAAACPSPGESVETAPPPWNVLFLAVDDLRSQMGCYGQTWMSTPNLDRLAATGFVFTRAYCQQAVCNPSRASLLTGCRPDTTGVTDLKTHFRAALPAVVTLPQLFRQHGYLVRGMGKIFHRGLNDPASWSVPWQSRGIGPEIPVDHAGDFFTPEGVAWMRTAAAEAAAAGRRKAKALPWESPDVPDDYMEDGRLANLAVEALGEMRERGQPFFLAVGFHKPHLPFTVPRRYHALYAPERIPLAPNPLPPRDVPACALSNWVELRGYHGIPDTGPLSDELARQAVHHYCACVSYVDAQIGRVVDALGRLGLRDTTVIVLWGDHGWKLGEHGEWCKHTNFETDTNAPLIVSIPGRRGAGQRTAALVEFVDIYPSLAELCGLPLPAHLEGTSFVPLLHAPDRAWKRAAFSQYPRSTEEFGRLMGYSMRTPRYRFTQWKKVGGGEVVGLELYDHDTDPGETVNIAGLPASAARIRELTAMADAGWRGALPGP